jgi:hypothetical protein
MDEPGEHWPRPRIPIRSLGRGIGFGGEAQCPPLGKRAANDDQGDGRRIKSTGWVSTTSSGTDSLRPRSSPVALNPLVRTEMASLELLRTRMEGCTHE